MICLVVIQFRSNNLLSRMLIYTWKDNNDKRMKRKWTLTHISDDTHCKFRYSCEGYNFLKLYYADARFSKNKTITKWRNNIVVYQSPLILTELFQHNLINVSYLTACYLYQVMVTLHFLNDDAYDAEWTQNRKLRHNR